MRKVGVICPECGHTIIYKNWFIWVLRNPFHWFNKRKVKCPKCGHKAYLARICL
jgi:DNA-directed RNA polymerase subunit RPC12/RpoP